MSCYALVTHGSFLGFAAAVTCTAAINALLIFLKKEHAAAIVLVLMLTVLIGYRSVLIRSTLNASFLPLALLVAAFLTGPVFMTTLFAAQLGFVVTCAFLGVFSWTQAQDPVTGLYYANTVTVLLPNLVITYLVALVVSKVLIGAIEKEARQTELLRKTQERLVAEERLASARILAGGIAHDFNNILVSLIGNLDLMKNDLDEADIHTVLLEDAQAAAERARDLTRQLLMLSKGTPQGTSMLSAAELIRETAIMTLRGSKCRAEFDIAADLWPIEADATQIAQIIQNLTLNASEAMPQGGVVSLEAKNRVRDAEPHRGLAAGPYIEISVRDQGTGIAPEHIGKIFEPFFSTKERGTGLGLSICYSVVSNHHGGIDCHSDPGAGATFTVYLPARPDLRPQPRCPEGATSSAERTGRVLVMDDDHGVQFLLRRMLEHLGYVVDLVDDGLGAERAYATALQRGEPYRFVIMDLTIPGGIGGEEALPLLRRLDPNVRAIVSSGYSTDLVPGTYLTKGFRALLRKPYTLSEVARAVDEACLPPPPTAS
jgi:signal transduction histidine kinase/CheY-like chemotaxis protein